MSKHPTRNKPTSTEPPAGLDVQITTLTVRARQGLEKHWKKLVALLGAVLIVAIAFQAIGALSERGRVAQSARVFALTDGVAADEAPDVDAMRTLLDELRGSDGEANAYRRVVAFLLSRASSEKPSAKPFSISTETDDAEDAEAVAAKARVLEAAKEFATLGAQRFPTDEAVQKWSAGVGARGDAETDMSWLPEKRSYKLKAPGVLPPSAPGASSETNAVPLPPITEDLLPPSAPGASSEGPADGSAGGGAGPADAVPPADSNTGAEKG